MKFKRVFLVVLDSLGVGEALDAASYDDSGANTLKHINDKHHLFIPNLEKLGFLDTLTMNDNDNTDAYYTIAKPSNPGKETLTGHYELVGVKIDYPFKSFQENGFPSDLINEIQRITGRKVLGNVAASGTEIIKELGETQIQTGGLIVYTSSDSVLQIAAHEKIIPLEELYKICEKVRQLTLRKEWLVGRVIARPFTGNSSDTFVRTENRRDFALNPPMPSVMNFLSDSDKNYSVISIGKIFDIFNGDGITKKIVAHSNKESIDKLIELLDKKFTGLCFTNLNDFDTLYGHRRDSKGYAEAIEALDVEIPVLLNKLNNDDLLIFTADHGNDPTYKGTDHTRENVPVIVYSRIFNDPKKLPALSSFADIAATISDNFDVRKPIIGKSFLDMLK